MFKFVQITGLVLGSLLVLWFSIDTGAGELQRRQLIDQVLESEPDTSLWSDKRASHYGQGQAIGVIRIPAIGLEAPIVVGTGEASLNAGVGWMKASAPLSEQGNVVLAAHRDGFFRGLKDLPENATIEIITAEEHFKYIAMSTQIVEEDDVKMR